MRTARAIAGILAALLVLALAAGNAMAARKVGWPDLLPPLPPIEDPLQALTADQRIELETILWVRQLNDIERAERQEIVEEAKRYEEALRGKGIVVDTLIQDYAAYDAKMTVRQGKVNETLAGQAIAIKGYLLPLDFAPEGVSEFLLVPYVGACIHVPAPPANQIVLVTLSEKMKVEEIYTPVEITGVLHTKSASKKLYLVDGASDVNVGYHIDNATIETIE